MIKKGDKVNIVGVAEEEISCVCRNEQKKQIKKMNWWRKFLCNVLGLHKPDKTLSFDGCSFHSVCKYCGNGIMQDSQGNWF